MKPFRTFIRFDIIMIMLCLLMGRAAFASEIIRNVRVTEDREKKYFVLFQSASEQNLWYCGQVKPKILHRNNRGEKIPEISLIRFQKKDIKDPEKLLQGGYFKMNLSLGPADESYEALKQKVADVTGNDSAKLSPVPFGALKLCLQKPDGKEVQMKAETLSGISNMHSSQNVAFSIKLDTLDTDLLDALLNGNTGAKYHLYYNYKYQDPVITGRSSQGNLNQRGFDSEPDYESDPRFGSDHDRDLPGSRDFDRIEDEFEQEQSWERAGEGFVGFASYSDSVRKKCVFIEQNEGLWQNAYLSLPSILQPDKIKINKVELDVVLKNQGKSFGNKTFTWTPERKWLDKYNAPVVYGVFDISRLSKKYPEDLNNSVFEISVKIESGKDDLLEQQTRCDMIVGDTPVTNPLSLADVLEFNTTFLSWSNSDKDGLQRIEIELKQGDWQASRTLKPDFKKSPTVYPDVAQWLVKKSGEKPLTAEVYFIVKDNGKIRRIPWSLNGKNLREELFGLNAFFFDKHWKG
ncbi:MAG: hypothetical protein ACQETH_09315 [Candidatus Rifleibacteriota bacterium]